jgi:hypothetical protein
MTDWILAGEMPTSHGIANDRHMGIGRVRLIKPSATEQWNA